MVSPGDYLVAALDPYTQQLKLLEPWVRDWTTVSFDLRHTRVVLSNEYVHMHVFKWLHEHVGPHHQFIRNNKFAQGKGWAYTVTDLAKTDDPYPIHYIHTFFFEDANDAMRFKLTWA